MGSERSKSPNPPISESPNSWSLPRWAQLLDSEFRIPGTNIRFGLDPVLSLIPGIGDLASPVYTALLIVRGLAWRVPKVVMARMVLNAAVDAVIGAIPIAGSVGDIFWRANTKNLSLLQRHARPGVPPQPPTTGDYVFVFGILTFLLALVVVPIIVAIWLMRAIVVWVSQ